MCMTERDFNRLIEELRAIRDLLEKLTEPDRPQPAAGS
jgi:hypothetical protein